MEMFPKSEKQNKTSVENKTEKQNVGKRKRPLDDDWTVKMNNEAKRTAANIIFRPWCDQPMQKILSPSAKGSNESVTSQEALHKPNTTPLTAYQMTLLQQQSKNAAALRQAYFQGQMIIHQMWAQQRQQQYFQMICQYQQKMQQQQQLFAFGQPQLNRKS